MVMSVLQWNSTQDASDLFLLQCTTTCYLHEECRHEYDVAHVDICYDKKIIMNKFYRANCTLKSCLCNSIG